MWGFSVRIPHLYADCRKRSIQTSAAPESIMRTKTEVRNHNLVFYKMFNAAPLVTTPTTATGVIFDIHLSDLENQLKLQTKHRPGKKTDD